MQSTNRREFIRTIVLTAASLVVIPGIAGADSAPDTTSFVDLGPASQFAGGTWTRVVLPAQYNKVAIFVRKAAGHPTPYQALSSRCTHEGCTVAYLSDERQFLCPCHHGRYDSNGVNIAGPPPDPLPSLATRVDSKKRLLVQAPLVADSDSD